jgi:hypothetical protein
MVAFARFAELHPDERDLTHALFAEACRERRNAFLAFMLLWMSFNGWMACVTDEGRDADMIDALSDERRISQAFDRLLRCDAEFEAVVRDFADWWPIFNVHDVRRRVSRTLFYEVNTREELRERLHSESRVRRGPSQWHDRRQPRWADLLSATYQIRCNLFHGQKSPTNRADRALVRLAFDCLHHFIVHSRCYTWHD